MKWIVGLLCAVLLTGCRSGNTVELWRDAVEEYVRHGGGDLGALQNAGDSNAPGELRPALATVSARGIWATDATPAAYRDAHGMLVGLAQTARGPWYVFAIGICETPADGAAPPRPVDVRIAAVSGGPDRFEWLTAPPDSEQTARYLASRPADWPAFSVRWPFPRAADDFALSGSGADLRVVERQSGAGWKLVLPAE